MKLSVLVAFITILIFCNFQVAQAASFDCRIASSKVEKHICADKDLSELDSSLGTLYSSLSYGSVIWGFSPNEQKEPPKK